MGMTVAEHCEQEAHPSPQSPAEPSTSPDLSPAFRVAYVDGVTPAKWVRVWNERHPQHPIQLVRTGEDQVSVLHDGRADMAFVRLPIERSLLNVIPLYVERAFAVASRDHMIASVDELCLADLEGETVHESGADLAETIALVASGAGAGVVIVPQSLARLHARRDVVSRPVTDSDPTEIALIWPADDSESSGQRENIDGFIGIVRGRTARSSRGESTEATSKTSTNTKATNAGRPSEITKAAAASRSRGNTAGSRRTGRKRNTGRRK